MSATEFVICYPPTAGHGACPLLWLMYSVGHHEENQFFLCKWISTGDSLLVSDWSTCILFLLLVLGSRLA